MSQSIQGDIQGGAPEAGRGGAGTCSKSSGGGRGASLYKQEHARWYLPCSNEHRPLGLGGNRSDGARDVHPMRALHLVGVQ